MRAEPGKTLQNGLPRVKASDRYYRCKGYQSLQEEGPRITTKSIPVQLPEERVKALRRRRQRASCCWNMLIMLLTLFIIRKWSSHYYPKRPYFLMDTSDHDDDDHKTEILHALTKLDEEIEGDIILCSSKEKCQQASRVWRQDVGLPLAVVEPKTQDDVRIAVPILAGLSRDYQMQFRIRSGGHSYGGYSTVTNGIVLSLSKLSALELDQTNSSSKTVRIEPGVRVEQFLQEMLDQQEYSGVVGDAAGVAFGGFLSGGGYGLQSRLYGLGIDQIVSLKLVLTNGDVKEVAQGDDLFWAIRGGGGGNFGALTEVQYRVYPSKDVKLGAKIQIPFLEVPCFLQQLGEQEPDLAGEFIAMVDGYQHYSTKNLSSKNTVHDDFAENGTATVSLYWMGDSSPDKPVGMDYIKKNVIPLFSNNSQSLMDFEESFYYFSWSAMSREREQPQEWSTIFAAQSWNGFLLPQNNTKEIWQDIRATLSVMFRYSMPFLQPQIQLWGGAIAKPSYNDTAFPHRKAVYNVGVQLLVPNCTDLDANQVFQQQSALVEAIWPSIAKYLTGVYVNYPMSSLTDKIYPHAYWGKNLDRLQTLKQQYDPFHVLTYDQSIPTKNEMEIVDY